MRNGLIHCLIICFLIIVVSIAVTARDSHNFYFKQLSLQDGLVQNYVRSIMLDHNGFYWIGTRSGLSRFDGYEFRNYRNDANDENSLSDDMIYYVVEDGNNDLWVSTSGGMELYNRDIDGFEHISYGDLRFRSYSYMKTDSSLLFGCSGKIFEYSYETRKIEPLPMFKMENMDSFFTYMAIWNSESVLLSTRWNGMWLYNIHTRVLERFRLCSELEIMATFIDSKGRLWISPYGKGLVGYSPNGELLVEIDSDNTDLSNNIILDIEERDGQLWLATDGGGISVYDMENNSFQNINYVVGDRNSFPFSSVFCLYNDDNNNMWAGTVRGGLIGIKEVYMHSYVDAPSGSNGLSDRSVQCLYEDEDGYIWIGTDGGGLTRLEPNSNRFKHYPSTFNLKVGSITGYSDDELLVFFYSKGLYLFNRKTGNIKHLLSDSDNAAIARSAISINVSRFAPNRIHLFTDNIYTYSLQHKSLTKLDLPSELRNSGAMIHFYVDSAYTYVFGQKSIARIYNQTDKVETVLLLPNNGTTIYSASYDGKGNIWMGTNKGLLRFNENNKSLETIETNMFKEVTAVVFSDSGLWLGAQNMLFRYIEKDNRFLIYGESDGAMDNEYTNKATLVSTTGDIYLGGITGLIRVDGSYFLSTSSSDLSPLSVSLADVMLDGASVNGILSRNSGKIRIPWDHTSLVMKFMVREKDVFRKKMFRYYINGLDRPYIETYNPTLMLYSLPCGNSEILVSCSTHEGGWSVPQKLIDVEVVPPWWLQWWFILIVVAIVLMAVYLGFGYSLRRKRNRMLLELKEKERIISEDKVRFLINISHELRTPLTLIYAPLKRLVNNDLSDVELVKKQLNTVLKQARRMRNIINMVLDMRRMESGQEKLYIESNMFNSWVESVTQEFAGEYQSKGMTLEFIPDNNIGMVPFDKAKCEIVLSNLLMNAFKYSDEGTNVIVGVEHSGNRARVFVKDRGMGLSQNDLDNIFTRFYQGDHRVGGSGIGLSYSKALIEQHGGAIGAYNNPDGGATFWFEIPLADYDRCVSVKPGDYLNDFESELEAGEVETGEVTDFDVSQYTVLVVDDEIELRTFMSEVFEGVFKKVYTASNGEEALEIVYKYHPDVAVSDIMMPKMDGFEFCRRLKADNEISHTPVVLLTVRSSQESQDMSYKLGADAYLPKPFDVDLLLTRVRNLLRNRKQVRAYYSDSGILPSVEERTFSNVDENFLHKLNQLIISNIDNTELDVKFLTVEIGMSRASLYNKVKALTGMGVNDYINRVKIEQAMTLLSTTDLSITEVAERIGFSNSRYFSTLFKHFTSETPTSYKKKTANRG